MRVFSLDDLLRRRIPFPDDFSSAKEAFEERCIAPYLGKEVVGGFLYGSLPNGDASPSSDLDYFILIDDPDHRQVIRDAFRKVLDAYAVEVETRVVELSDAIRCRHGLQPSFLLYLRAAMSRNGFLGEDPLSRVDHQEASVNDSLRDDFSHYLSRLSQSFVNNSGSDYDEERFLRRVLTVPANALRHVVAYEHVRAGGAIEEVPVTKQGLLERFEKSYGEDAAADMRLVLDARKAYDDGLRLVRDGGLEREHIPLWKASMGAVIASRYGAAERFVRLAIDLVDGKRWSDL